MKLIDLAEGIVARTAQGSKRMGGAVDRLAEVLARGSHGLRQSEDVMTAFSSRLNYLEHLVRHDRQPESWEDSIDDALTKHISFFAITPEDETLFRQTMIFLAKEYAKHFSIRPSKENAGYRMYGMRVIPSTEELEAAQKWFTQMVHQLKKKYDALVDLSEGIVDRTSQHDRREAGAVKVIASALKGGAQFGRRQQHRLENFEDTLVTLAAFLEVPSDQPPADLDWFFQNRFDELRIKPKDRPPYSPHFKNALMYLANRYNQLESADEDNVQEWYYGIVDEIETRMNEGSRQS